MKPATRIDASTKPPTGPAGRVTAPFEAGSVLLGAVAIDGDAIRLVWKKGDKALAVPAGRYMVRHWSIEKQHEGETWIMSVSGPTGRVVEVKAGEELALDLDTKVHVQGQLRRHGKSTRLQLSITGGDGMGLSVIRKDKLVEIGYRIEGANGKEVGKGVMTYG